MRYLYDDQHYIDLYDLLTIKECLDWEKGILERKLLEHKGKKIPKKNELPLKKSIVDFALYFIKGERYKNKNSRIQEWIAKDKEKQEFYDKTPEPSRIFCNNCGDLLHSDMKHLEDYMDTPMRVLFYFPCKTCKVKRAFYNTGEEHISNPPLCPKCGSILKENHSVKNKGKVITWTKTCLSCGFIETEIDDFEKSRSEWEKEKQEDRDLLQKWRVEFCLSDEEGRKYVEYTLRFMSTMKMLEDSEQKKADPAYQKALNLKKLSIGELEKLLNKVLIKEKYLKLSLDKPEMEKYVIVPFTVQDADSSRKEKDSTHKLQRIIKSTLEETNWRLMSDGTSYRLGYVYGRFKGYEREEDMANLFRAKTSNDNKWTMKDDKGNEIKF